MEVVKYNSYFIKAFDSNDSKSEVASDGLVYHYTSPEAFLSIIKSGKVRFTDVRYLNDKSETLFFVKKLVEFIEKRKEDYPIFLEIVDFLLQEENWENIKQLRVEKLHYNENTIIPFKSDRLFVFCASKEADALNMWNYYVKNGFYQGYNLGINIKKFVKTFDTDSSNTLDSFIVYYGNVLYDEKQQFSEIEQLAQEFNKTNTVDKMSFHGAVLKLRAYIELQGLFYKSPKFQNEKEYRVVISIANERIPHNEQEAHKYFGMNNQKMTEDFFVRGGLIVPSISVVLPKDSISRVYISPITEYEIAKASTKELLEINGFKNDKKAVSIYKSLIPIRF